MNKPISELLKFSIINIDKPAGPTSFSVSDYVRKKLGLNKTSHFGTLDPAVTGVLPIALGRACKLTGFFLGHDKEYVGVIHVHEDISMDKLQEIINKKFLGKIMQLPPKKSSVRRQVREREIKSFELLEQDGRDILFRTEVQGGTYIRKLISDLGEEKDVGGAHMAELRRIRAGVFSEPSVNLYEFKEAVELYESGKEEKLRKMLVPGEEAIKKVMPIFELTDENELKGVLTGKPLFKSFLKGDFNKIGEGEFFAVFYKERFLEIAKRVDEGEMFGKPEFVYN